MRILPYRGVTSRKLLPSTTRSELQKLRRYSTQISKSHSLDQKKKTALKRHQCWIGMARTTRITLIIGVLLFASTTLLSQVSSASQCKLCIHSIHQGNANLTHASTFGTSVYTPAISGVMAAFSISRTAALLGLTVFTFGLGFGPVISAPLSEQHGRKIVYLVSAPIFILFTLGAGFSNHLASLLVCRFFAGLTGSPALAVGAGTNADLFPPRARAVVSSVFLMAPFLGPSIGYVCSCYALPG